LANDLHISQRINESQQRINGIMTRITFDLNSNRKQQVYAIEKKLLRKISHPTEINI